MGKQLITVNYFKGDITLPGSALSGEYSDINGFIERYEKMALIELLGYTLYKELKAEIDAASYSTKWDRLVNGHEYTVDYLGGTHTVKWNGLVNTDQISLIAYFIYYHYVKHHITHTSGFGESLAQGENATRISPVHKLSNAWNRFVELRGQPYDAVINPTAYNFLNEFEDDAVDGYDLWLFSVRYRTNSFGI